MLLNWKETYWLITGSMIISTAVCVTYVFVCALIMNGDGTAVIDVMAYSEGWVELAILLFTLPGTFLICIEKFTQVDNGEYA